MRNSISSSRLHGRLVTRIIALCFPLSLLIFHIACFCLTTNSCWSAIIVKLFWPNLEAANCRPTPNTLRSIPPIQGFLPMVPPIMMLPVMPLLAR